MAKWQRKTDLCFGLTIYACEIYAIPIYTTPWLSFACKISNNCVPALSINVVGSQAKALIIVISDLLRKASHICKLYRFAPSYN